MIIPNGQITIYREIMAEDPRYGTRSKKKSKETLFSGEVQWRYLSEDRHTPKDVTTRETASIEALIPYNTALPPTAPVGVDIEASGHTIIATARTIEHLQLVGVTRIIATLSNTKAGAGDEGNPAVHTRRG